MPKLKSAEQHDPVRGWPAPPTCPGTLEILEELLFREDPYALCYISERLRRAKECDSWRFGLVRTLGI